MKRARIIAGGGEGVWKGESREEGKVNPHLPYAINRQFQKLINREVGRHACFVFQRSEGEF